MVNCNAFKHGTSRGFTLLEMVIVLGVTGIIFAGLWGLLSGGNSQLQAQSAAQQYRQVIDAARQYIISTYGNKTSANTGVMITNVTVAVLRKPASSGGPGLLSPTFSTTDVFGNPISIIAETIDATKNQFRIMVFSGTRNAVGNVVSDKVGAQVSALIGSDGGFIYAQPTPGCAGSTAVAQHTACGAYNSFAFDVHGTPVYLTAADESGRIANLTYTSDSSAGLDPYLYRKSGYATTSRDRYTMQTNMYFGTAPLTTASPTAGVALYMLGKTINMGGVDASGALKTGGGTLNMAAGSIQMKGASTDLTGGGTLNMSSGSITNARNIIGHYDPAGPSGPFGTTGLLRFTGLQIDTCKKIGPVATATCTPGYGNGITVTVPNGGSGMIIQTQNGVNVNQNTPPNVLSVWGSATFFNLNSLKFLYSSDERLKKDIVDLKDPLEKIMQLKGHAFTWKQSGDKTIGLIAQEVQKVYPDIVTADSKGMLSVDYGKLVAPLVESVKELKKENDALKSRLDKLERDGAAKK